jgi:hypothetical protein
VAADAATDRIKRTTRSALRIETYPSPIPTDCQARLPVFDAPLTLPADRPRNRLVIENDSVPDG